MQTRPIALLTDFGTQDPYVGIMKGVIVSLAPQAPIIDLTHGVSPGNIRQAAFQLWQAAPFLPENCIIVAVVDPGVGTQRRAVAIDWPRYTCLSPDNGLTTYLMVQAEALTSYELQEPAFRLPTTSSTFHGRDIFAPAAAHLAMGLPVQRLGPPAGHLTRLSLPKLAGAPKTGLRGEILHTDRFGNQVTSLGKFRLAGQDLVLEPWLPGCKMATMSRADVRLLLPEGTRLELKQTFSSVPPGEPLCYIGSAGLLEIGVNQGSAADRMHLTPGDEIVLLEGG